MEIWVHVGAPDWSRWWRPLTVPLHLRDLRRRMAIEIAAGPLASLLTAVIAMGVLSTVPGSSWVMWWKVPAVVAAMSAGALVINLIPQLVRPQVTLMAHCWYNCCLGDRLPTCERRPKWSEQQQSPPCGPGIWIRGFLFTGGEGFRRGSHGRLAPNARVDLRGGSWRHVVGRCMPGLSAGSCYQVRRRPTRRRSRLRSGSISHIWTAIRSGPGSGCAIRKCWRRRKGPR